MIKLHGNPLSTCTRRVAVVLKEKEVPYELVPVDFGKGEHKLPSHLENQPFGQVPYIQDGDLKFFESRAICRYIALKYANQGTPLLPPTSDLVATAKFEQAASIEQCNFDVFAVGIATERVFKLMRGGETDQQLLELCITTLNSKLDVYEIILSKQKYLAGEEVTLADLFHLPYGYLLDGKLDYDFLRPEKRPHVARWWKDISSRPSWLAVKDRA